MNIKITTGGYEVIASGWLQAEPHAPVDLKTGGITTRFIYKEDSDNKKPATLRAESDHDQLILTIYIEGVLPVSPLIFGSVRPIKVGTADGQSVFLSWQASKLMTPAEQYCLSYTLYCALPVNNEQPKTPIQADPEGGKP